MKLLIVSCFFLLCSVNTSAQRLVLPGDHPDPSVVKIGDTYWASATSSNWFPAYPLLKSKDLVNWTLTGHVFNTKPTWADYYFWAPEINYEKGKVYIYYAAHKKGGNLCIGIASADKPEGPYTDHGALICEEAGSIDAFPMRDENGKLFLIWKEDGNSVRKPTPIWAVELNEARTAVVGEKKELFRNDAPWENNLVEGVSMMKHGDYFYAFYAAAGCCGTGCTYATGIARSKSLLGPWEKNPKNPLLTNNENWKCPGHGTPVEKEGKFYFLYHAYNNISSVYTGRQGLLVEFRFTNDGWVEFENEKLPAANVDEVIEDNFKGKTLSKRWEWSVFQDVNVSQSAKKLSLRAMPSSSGAFVAQKNLAENYIADIRVMKNRSDAMAGIGAIGDDKNSVAVLVKNDSAFLVRIQNDKSTTLVSKKISVKHSVYLRMEVKQGKDFNFYVSGDQKNYQLLNESPVNGAYLPPWDRAVRVGLISKGTNGQKAVFKKFRLKTGRPSAL